MSTLLGFEASLQSRVTFGVGGAKVAPRKNFLYRFSAKTNITANANTHHRKPPNWAKVPSSTHGFSIN